jgi:pimeloyl-ACP methyl ester carboxylesterase
MACGGTGQSNPLHCQVPGRDEDPQSYLEPVAGCPGFSAPDSQGLRKRLRSLRDRAGVPTLLISATSDPVTPPRWGEEAVRHLPNSLHVVAPEAHGVDGDCIVGIQQAFLETASVKGLDTSCVATMKLTTLPPGRTARRVAAVRR